MNAKHTIQTGFSRLGLNAAATGEGFTQAAPYEWEQRISPFVAPGYPHTTCDSSRRLVASVALDKLTEPEVVSAWNGSEWVEEQRDPNGPYNIGAMTFDERRGLTVVPSKGLRPSWRRYIPC